MQEQLDIIWRETLGIVKDRLNTPTFKTWFANARPLTLYDGIFVISAPNAFAKDWLERRYQPLLTDALSEVIGDRVKVKFMIKDRDSAEPPSTEGQDTSPPAIMGADGAAAQTSHDAVAVQVRPTDTLDERARQLSDYLNPKYTFDSFVTGGSNRFAHAAALAVAEKPAQAYNPLFIYGGVGLGKTHLLQAIAHYVRQHFAHLRVKYVSSEKFTNDFINSIRDKDKIVGFQKRYRNTDVLLIDDIHFLQNKEATQEEFFHTFNTLYEASRQVVISSDRPPKDIATLEDRLRSRFEWGLITDIQPPDLETRIAILRKKALLENLSVPDDVLEYIASKIQSHIRELEGALTRTVAFASLTNNDVNLEVAQEILKEVFPEQASRPVAIKTIQNETCRYFDVERAELIGNRRSQSIAYPRQMAMYLSRELTDLSLPKIGEEFGGRDHTTVMYANSKIEKLITQKRDAYNQVQELINRIKRRTR